MFCTAPCFLKFAAQIGQIITLLWNKSLKEIVDDALKNAAPVIPNERFYLVS